LNQKSYKISVLKKFLILIQLFVLSSSFIYAQQDAQYYFNQGNKKFIQSEYKDALDNYDEAVRLDSSMYYAYVSRAEVKTELGMYDSALQDYEQYRIIVNSLNLLEDPGIVRQMNDLEKIKSEGGAAIANQGPSSYETYEATSEDSASGPIVSFNEERWENALNYNPDDLRALFLKGNYQYQNGNYPQALGAFNKAISLDQSIFNLFNARGYVRLKMNDLYGALDDFNKALSLQNNEYFSLVGRGEVQSKLRNYDQSIVDYSKAIQLEPNQYPGYYGRAISWFKMKNFPKSIDDFSQTIQIKSNHAKAFFNRGLARYNLEETDLACADWQQSNTLGHNKAYDYIKSYCK
jgi:tetratricopeptide (TPR) repeat protein